MRPYQPPLKDQSNSRDMVPLRKAPPRRRSWRAEPVPQGDRGLRLPLSLVELRRAVSAQLRAEFNANAWSGRIEGGYRLVSPWRSGVGIAPYAAGQFTTFELPACAESVVSGAGMFALSYAALPGASFVVNGAAHAANSALTTASAEVKWINGWSAAATFEGEFSEVTRSYAGKAVVRYAW